MTLIHLPEELRQELKEPLGPVKTDAVEPSTGRLVTVGDIVTTYFLDNDVTPDVAVVDGRTKRQEVDQEIVEKWRSIPVLGVVENQAGTISSETVKAMQRGLHADRNSLIEVEGEEDLAVLPAIVLSNSGDTVVYGQPGEGMVYVEVNDEVQREVYSLLEKMDIKDRDEFEKLLCT